MAGETQSYSLYQPKFCLDTGEHLTLPYSPASVQRFAEWKRSGVDLYAPLLIEYELTSLLRRMIVGGTLTAQAGGDVLHQLLPLSIHRVPPTADLHEQALRWAARLGQSKAYDAHYLALAEQLGIEFWTADRRLMNGARQAGASWVHWVEE